jgi:branched-chain amino acid transport system substrate-binding protein
MRPMYERKLRWVEAERDDRRRVRPGMVEDQELLVGAAVSLSGPYARQGRMAAAGLAQAVDDTRRAGGVATASGPVLPRLVLLDDGGTREGLRRALDALGRADLLIGPYGSGLTGEAADWAGRRGRVLWNHGGSADEVEAMPWVVSVSSPTSRYLAAVLEVLAPELAGARVMVGAGTGSFGRAASRGAAEAADRLGLQLTGTVPSSEVPEAPHTDVLLLAGSFDEDVAVLRRLRSRPRTVAAVAGGLGEFVAAVGRRRADGVLAPSQWEEGARFRPDFGPRTVDVVRALRFRLAPRLAMGADAFHVEYPAAQAYAAVVVALCCVQEAPNLDDEALLAVARSLHCTTFFGGFGLGRDGRQADHQLVVIQWRDGVKRIVGPPGLAEEPAVL